MQHFFNTVRVGDTIAGSVSAPLLVTLHAIAKTNEKIGFGVANEYIAGQLGRFIGLPLAPGGLCRLDGRTNLKAYVNLKFNFRTTEDLPPIDPEEAVAHLPDPATGIALFDIWIANPDRHCGNLRGIFHKPPHEILVFDHGHALFGHDEGYALDRFKDLKDRLGVSGGVVTGQNRHCLIDFLSDHSLFGKWIQRIQLLPDYVIEDASLVLRDANLLTDIEAAAVSEFLKYRRDRLSSIVDNHKHEFTGITQWGLNL